VTTELLHSEDVGPELVVPGAGGAGIEARSPLQLFWRRFRKDKVALAAGTFIVVLIIVAVLAEPIRKLVGAPPPNLQQTSALDDFGLPQGPSSEHLFGVDQIGRDVFSRTLYGARVSLEVALVATAISVVVGVVLGMIAGYFRGWVDTVLSRIMDIQLAFPVLLLAIGLGAACSLGNGCFGGLLKPGLQVVIFVIALAQWPYMARIIRGQVLSLREKEFIEAAKSLGASDFRIIFREILPNLVAPIIVYSTILIPTNILFEAALSFLGVGVRPPTPSWGSMLNSGYQYLEQAPWLAIASGSAIFIAVLGLNFVGDGLRTALDPRLAQRGS
jgi:ABC-type dipeptide/oligopeptide/nickel transport system permease subunit